MNRNDAELELRNQKWLDPYRIRQDFPILGDMVLVGVAQTAKPLVYLDTTATSQKPRQVIAAMNQFYEHDNANIHRGLYQLAERATARYEASRAKIAKFIGAASVQEIIFTRSTTESINLIAAAWGRKFVGAGDIILLTEMEHHSNLVPWQMLAKEKQASLKFIPVLDDGTLDLSHLDELLSGRVKLVAMTHISNVLGTINPVKTVIDLAHAKGITVLLDGAQSVPHSPVDVTALDCDFLAFSGHKMCGPTGIGVLYGKRKLLEAMEPYQGGGDMISSVWFDRATWNELPYKFEAGTPDIAGAIGLGAAVDYLTGIGMDNIARYEAAIAHYAVARVKEIAGLRLLGDAKERCAVLSLIFADIHPHDVAQFLDNEGIAVRAGHHCAQPLMRKFKLPATTRASFYFYNTIEEVDKLVANLQKVKEFFSHGI